MFIRNVSTSAIALLLIAQASFPSIALANTAIGYADAYSSAGREAGRAIGKTGVKRAAEIGLFNKLARNHPKTTALVALGVLAGGYGLYSRHGVQNSTPENQMTADDEAEDASMGLVCLDSLGNIEDPSICGNNGVATVFSIADFNKPGVYNDGAPGHIVAASNSSILTANMEGALDANQTHINPKKPAGCAAHHIVMAGPWPNDFSVQNSRDILRRCNIDVNSFLNGVYLPNIEKGGSRAGLPLICAAATNHRDVHTQSYRLKVYERLRTAYNIDYKMPKNFLGPAPRKECVRVKMALGKMKLQMQLGIFP